MKLGFNLDDIFLINKRKIAYALFCIGILLGIVGSLQTVFMWRFSNTYSILAAFPIILSIYIARNSNETIYNRTDYIWPLAIYVLLQVLINIISQTNINSYINLFFNTICFYALFCLDMKLLKKLSKILCMIVAVYLSISIMVLFLYIIGVPLPSQDIAHPTLEYTYVKYPFLLVDDRQFLVFIPRFNSVCLEPGHLGTFCSFLLLTQFGNWRKWYNIILLTATLLTFSLAAYVLMTIILFVGAWGQRKRILPSIITIVAIISTSVVGSLYYNDGDNLINTLILNRLEVQDDGNISGNNRVTDEFQAEFDKYIQSSYIFFGRANSRNFGFGNAGYKVFLYDYGLICTLLVFIMYYISIAHSDDRRAKIGFFIVFIASFWVRATPLYYYYFVPLYIFAYKGCKKITNTNNQEIQKIINNEE